MRFDTRGPPPSASTAVTPPHVPPRASTRPILFHQNRPEDFSIWVQDLLKIVSSISGQRTENSASGWARAAMTSTSSPFARTAKCSACHHRGTSLIRNHYPPINQPRQREEATSCILLRICQNRRLQGGVRRFRWARFWGCCVTKIAQHKAMK